MVTFSMVVVCLFLAGCVFNKNDEFKEIYPSPEIVLNMNKVVNIPHDKPGIVLIENRKLEEAGHKKILDIQYNKNLIFILVKENLIRFDLDTNRTRIISVNSSYNKLTILGERVFLYGRDKVLSLDLTLRNKFEQSFNSNIVFITVHEGNFIYLSSDGVTTSLNKNNFKANWSAKQISNSVIGVHAFDVTNGKLGFVLDGKLIIVDLDNGEILDIIQINNIPNSNSSVISFKNGFVANSGPSLVHVNLNSDRTADSKEYRLENLNNLIKLGEYIGLQIKNKLFITKLDLIWNGKYLGQIHMGNGCKKVFEYNGNIYLLTNSNRLKGYNPNGVQLTNLPCQVAYKYKDRVMITNGIELGTYK